MVREFWAVGVSLVLIAGAGRAMAQNAPDPKPIPVEVRAQQYWKAREARDLIAAHPFYCSAYRTRVPLNEFVKQTRLIRFELMDVTVTDAVPVGDRIAVTVEFHFLAPKVSAKPLDGQATELWAKDTDGQWCKEDEPLVVPYPKQPVTDVQERKP